VRWKISRSVFEFADTPPFPHMSHPVSPTCQKLTPFIIIIIIILKERYESELRSERENALRLKGENGILRKKWSAMQKDVDEGKEEVSTLFASKEKLYLHISDLEREIGELQQGMEARNSAIGEREKRLEALKSQNEQLDTLRSELECRIAELEAHVEPREAEIAKLTIRNEEITAEADAVKKERQALKRSLTNLQLKLSAVQREAIAERTKRSDANVQGEAIRGEIHECVQYFQEPKALKEAVKNLYHRHATENLPLAKLAADDGAHAAAGIAKVGEGPSPPSLISSPFITP